MESVSFPYLCLNPIEYELGSSRYTRLCLAMKKIWSDFPYDDMAEPLGLVHRYLEERIEDIYGVATFSLFSKLEMAINWINVYNEIYNSRKYKDEYIYSLIVSSVNECFNLLGISYTE